MPFTFFKFEIGITTCYTKYFLNSTLKSIYNSQSLYTKRYLDSSCFRSSIETIVPLVIREGSSNNTNLKGKKPTLRTKWPEILNKKKENIPSQGVLHNLLHAFITINTNFTPSQGSIGIKNIIFVRCSKTMCHPINIPIRLEQVNPIIFFPLLL